MRWLWRLMIHCIAHSLAATDSLYCACAAAIDSLYAHALAVTDSLYCACAGCCWFTVLRKCWLLLIQCIVHALTVTDSLYCAWAGCYWFTILSMHWLFLIYCICACAGWPVIWRLLVSWWGQQVHDTSGHSWDCRRRQSAGNLDSGKYALVLCGKVIRQMKLTARTLINKDILEAFYTYLVWMAHFEQLEIK